MMTPMMDIREALEDHAKGQTRSNKKRIKKTMFPRRGQFSEYSERE
jgi:hypothetical protein